MMERSLAVKKQNDKLEKFLLKGFPFLTRKWGDFLVIYN